MKCLDCKFYVPDSVATGHCLRLPKPIFKDKPSDQWCGEYRINRQSKGKKK